ncbi:acyltransferase family protein [Catellatospora vulcania]|uniref:acyltransferase family protein n=1 Tax=Catellatospora vulcania TaxID=1460450 RepID=UPI0038B3A5C3
MPAPRTEQQVPAAPAEPLVPPAPADPAPAATPAQPKPAHAGFRRDIEGIRALAVVLVMVGHAGVSAVSGGFVGVDVFFVISGFLITGLLVSEIERTGRISLTGFYARRAKRLLPAAAVVLAASLVLTYTLLPTTRWRGIGWDVIASGLYVMNWRLADQAVDYLAATDAPSILQHFWSLAVEEQFYLVWPLLLIAVSWLAARRGGPRRTRPLFLAGLALIGIPSLVWSIQLTETDPARAYFVTTTRLWELALGAGVAILGGRLARMPRSAGAVLGWVGLVAVVVAALVTDKATPFPGYAALLPTLGTAAIIAGGMTAGRRGPELVLGLRPVRAIGAVSYSLYLWHWPLLMVADSQFGPLSPLQGLGVVAFSAVPAVLTHRFVENPVRFGARFSVRPARALQLGLACTVIPLAAALTFQFVVLPAATRVDPDVVSAGAAALPAPSASQAPPVLVDQVDHISPDPAAARDDLGGAYGNGSTCISSLGEPVRTCVFGAPDGVFTVALVGDSHAAHWFPAVETVAREQGWKLVTYLKSACPLLDAEVLYKGKPFKDCTEWNAEVKSRLAGPERPDLVIVSNSARYVVTSKGKQLSHLSPEGIQAAEQAMRTSWSGLSAAGPLVVVLRDVPRPDLDIPECVAKNREQLTRCAFPRQEAEASSVMQQRAASAAGLAVIDLTESICPGDRCPAVLGNVLIYRDDNHLTATYARSLAPRLATALTDTLRSSPLADRAFG